MFIDENKFYKKQNRCTHINFQKHFRGNTTGYPLSPEERLLPTIRVPTGDSWIRHCRLETELQSIQYIIQYNTRYYEIQNSTDQQLN